MALILPLLLNADTIPVVLAVQLKTPLMGDAQLHLLAGMPFRVADQVTSASVTTSATAVGGAALDITKIATEVSNRSKGSKHD